MSAYSQKRTFGTQTAFASPPSRCTIDTWSIKAANLAIKVIAAVLVLGVYSLVQGGARESSDLSQVGFRDRQADAFPGRDHARGSGHQNRPRFRLLQHPQPAAEVQATSTFFNLANQLFGDALKIYFYRRWGGS